MTKGTPRSSGLAALRSVSRSGAHGNGGGASDCCPQSIGLEAASGLFARAIDDHGRVVGYYYDQSGNAHGVLFDRGNSYTLPDALRAGNQTFPMGINDAGLIVGWYNDTSADHRFLYAGGNYTALNDPSATVNTFASGINLRNRVV